MQITLPLLWDIHILTGLFNSNKLLKMFNTYTFSGNFLRALYNQNVSGSLMLEDGSFADERWLLDNDLLLADSSYVDKLLGRLL